jgi:hypothetical protein
LAGRGGGLFSAQQNHQHHLSMETLLCQFPRRKARNENRDSGRQNQVKQIHQSFGLSDQKSTCHINH